LERIHSRIRLGQGVKTVIQSMSPLCYPHGVIKAVIQSMSPLCHPHGVKAFTSQCIVDRLMYLLEQNPLFVEDEISSLSLE
jgi:uncharacterized protein YwbE